MVNQFAIRGTWQAFGWGGQGSSPAALADVWGHQCIPGAEWFKVLGVGKSMCQTQRTLVQSFRICNKTVFYSLFVLCTLCAQQHPLWKDVLKKKNTEKDWREDHQANSSFRAGTPVPDL